MIVEANDVSVKKVHKKKDPARIRRCVASARLVKELRAEHKFYLVGEIVIDLDIFSTRYEEGEDFLPNPTNALKNLIKMTLCSSHIEFETASVIAPSS